MIAYSPHQTTIASHHLKPDRLFPTPNSDHLTVGYT